MLGFEVETVAVGAVGTTYRVYATFDDPACWVQSVFADATHPMLCVPESGTLIYQSPLVNVNLGQEVNPAFFGIFPGLAYDSWLTIGTENSGQYGGVQVLDFAVALAGFNAGTGFSATAGGWLVPGAEVPQAEWMAGPDLRVLLGQITMTTLPNGAPGDFQFLFNCAWRHEGVQHLFYGELESTAVPGWGCTDAWACNYDPDATVDSGMCEYFSCAPIGCTDGGACNFAPAALYEDGSCLFPEAGYDCAGGCLVDGDGDGVCDGDEVLGCTDAAACNYNAGATEEDGSCVVPGSEEGECCQVGCDGVTLWAGSDLNGNGVCDCEEEPDCADCSCTGDADGDGVCDDFEVVGCQEVGATNYAAGATDAGPCFFAVPDSWVATPTPSSGLWLGTVTVDGLPAAAGDWVAVFTAAGVCAGAAPVLVVNGTAFMALTVYGDDATSPGVVEGMGEGGVMFLRVWPSASGVAYDVLNAQGVPGWSGWTNTNGTPLPGLGQPTTVYNVVTGSVVVLCADPLACNFVAGSVGEVDCLYPAPGRDCFGACVQDGDGDGVCDPEEVLGCQDASACNFAPGATEPDGSCVYPDACGVCGGPGAIYACGCAELPVGACDCTGVQPDADGDGICDDVDPCVGAYDACGVCQGPGAIYACGCSGLPVGACDCAGNTWDALGECGGDCPADADGDGTCDDVDPCVGTLDACGVCQGPGPIYACGCQDLQPGTCDCDGTLLDALGDCGGDCPADLDGDGICDNAEIPGCPDPSACNFACGSTDDDGTCTYPPLGLTCAGDCLLDTDGDGICEQDEVPGCTDPVACNFDPLATDPMNNYCAYPEAGCDCAGDCPPDPCPADISGDGIIGTADLLAVLAGFGFACGEN